MPKAGENAAVAMGRGRANVSLPAWLGRAGLSLWGPFHTGGAKPGPSTGWPR